MAKIKLGENAKGILSIPVSVPVETEAPVKYSAVNVVQFVANDPDNGLEVTADQLAKMQADTNIDEKVAAGLLVIETE